MNIMRSGVLLIEHLSIMYVREYNYSCRYLYVGTFSGKEIYRIYSLQTIFTIIVLYSPLHFSTGQINGWYPKQYSMRGSRRLVTFFTVLGLKIRDERLKSTIQALRT